MLKEKVLLTVASGMLGTTLAVAPIVVNSTSLTQADVDQMSGIEKTVTKSAREFLNSLNGTEEQLTFEDENAREYLLDEDTINGFAEDTGEDPKDVKMSFTAIADINDTLIKGCKRIGEGLRQGLSEDEILNSISDLGVEITTAMNPIWNKMGYSSAQLKQDMYTLKHGNYTRNPNRHYSPEELEMLQPMIEFGNALGIEGFGM